jgi:alpha-1,2-mannosyltransferase
MEGTHQGWITQKRLTRAAQVIVGVFLLLWAYWFAQFIGLGGGAPNVDFIVYWTAAKLGAAGDAITAYDPTAFEAQQVEAVGESAHGFPWVYPPVAFVLVLPLSLLPYGAAFAAWLAATGAVFLTALRRLARNGMSFWLALAFPGTLFNLIIGQAGLLTAGLFAWAMLLLPSRPALAGGLLGLLALKPHFMPLVLLALLAGREVRAFGATLASAGVLVAISLVGFGFGPWEHFISQLDDSTALLYGDVFPVAKMQSVTALVLALGGSDLASQVVQGVTTLAAAGFVVWLWRSDAPLEYRAAGLGIASLLATPYVYHYDLTVMGVALLFFANRARETGWRPWERPLLAVAWFTPIASLVLGVAVSFTVGAPVLLALAAMLAHRVRSEGAQATRATVAEPAAA